MTATTIRVQMAQRKDTAANWTAANPILLSGEIGYETDNKKFKIGNGSTNWNSLAYLPIPDGSGNLTITGNLEIGNTGSLTFEGSTADGFETTLAVTNPTADRTITLPDRSGTVITSGDTGTVTSTMLADGTIVDADVNASAAIAGTKISPDFGSQTVQTTGIFSHALGTAGAPSIAFTGDTNTGIYSPGADQAAISTGGAERLRITSAGLVGVGTSAPGTNLDVNGTVRMRIAGGGTDRYVDIGSDGSGTTRFFNNYTGGGDFGFTWTIGASDRMALDASGRLGIGTTSPQYKLHVSQTGSAVCFGESGSAATVIGTNAAGTASQELSLRGFPLTFTGNGGGGSEAARIDSSGRLLVGTSSARQGTLFEIESTSGIAAVSITRNSNNGAGPSIALAKTRSSSNGVSSFGKVSADDSLGGIDFLGADGAALINAASIYAYADGDFATSGDATDGPGRLVFATTSDGASSSTERMRIKSTGTINFSNVATYADNTAALAGGLVAGDMYRKSDGTLMITY